MKKKLHVVLIYNAYPDMAAESSDDRGAMADLREMVRSMARAIRALGHKVTLLSLGNDLLAFQRKLNRLRPDVVFNQYDDVMHGALYEMRVAALVRMLGFPLTGSPALSLGLSRYKYMSASLLHGAGIPMPPHTELLARIKEVDQHDWSFPLIVQPGQEHAGIGVDRDSVVRSKKQLRLKVGEILKKYKQPALVQKFLPGREFNVGLVGGTKLTLLPLAEVNYTELPAEIPPIMSYAAKWVESSVEYQKTSVICPAVVEPTLAQLIGQVSLRAFRAVGGWGYGRVDIRLDAEGSPRVLEVNCNPCLDEGMGLARAAAAAGIPYPQLLQLIIKAAIEGPPFDITIPMSRFYRTAVVETPASVPVGKIPG